MTTYKEQVRPSCLAARRMRRHLWLLLLSAHALALAASAGRNRTSRPRRQISMEQSVTVAMDGQAAVLELLDVMDPDVFERITTDRFVEITSRAIRSVIPIVEILDSSFNSESMNAKLICSQFEEAHAKLDCAQVHFSEIKADDAWKLAYQRHYSSILVAGQSLEQYFNLPKIERQSAKNGLIGNIRDALLSVRVLFDALVSDHQNADSLSALAIRVTRGHRRQVMSFLLAVSRAVVRGAELHVAHSMLSFGVRSAGRFESNWRLDMQNLGVRLKAVDRALASEMWTKQSQIEVDLAIEQHGGLGSAEFAALVHGQLSEKFPWRQWLVLVFSEKPNVDTQQSSVWQCGGVFRYHVLSGRRSVVVASSDPATSLFSSRLAANLLATVERDGPQTIDTAAWWRHVSQRLGLRCGTAAFIGALCWGCGANWMAQQGRVAYRRLSSGGRLSVNFMLFG